MSRGEMKKNSHLRSMPNERAQSLVELAISLIILLTLLAGAVDFGIALYSYVSLRDAAQEGALYGSIDPTNTVEIENRIRSSSDAPVNLSDPSVAITINLIPSGQACEGSGNGIQIILDYDYQLIMPILPEILGVTEIPLSASVTDTILQPPCP